MERKVNTRTMTEPTIVKNFVLRLFHRSSPSFIRFVMGGSGSVFEHFFGGNEPVAVGLERTDDLGNRRQRFLTTAPAVVEQEDGAGHGVRDIFLRHLVG